MSYRPITDVWILARPKVRYYGAYPNGFLERARALLGVTPFDPVLHVCGGCARFYPAKPRGFGSEDRTMDVSPLNAPDVLGNAEQAIPWQADGTHWPALIADPPYTEADAKEYGTWPLPSANAILRNMLDVVRVGGRVGMLHYILPQPPRTGVRFVACVGVIVGFNNRMRCFSVFEREATR